jgi:hypothetical protein
MVQKLHPVSTNIWVLKPLMVASTYPSGCSYNSLAEPGVAITGEGAHSPASGSKLEDIGSGCIGFDGIGFDCIGTGSTTLVVPVPASLTTLQGWEWWLVLHYHLGKAAWEAEWRDITSPFPSVP